jgi:hypothetical protein
MGNPNIKRDKDTIASYVAICQTFLEGVVRVVDAQVAFTSIMRSFTTYRAKKVKAECDDEVLAEILASFDNVSLDQFWAAQYVNAVSTLVYMASLFDTFLNESTIFLFLLIPDAIGKSYQVPLRSLIDGQSRGSILTEVAKERAREVSYRSFKDRLRFLHDTFGLPIVLNDKTVGALDYFANLRNTAVHDQGFLALTLDDSGCIRSTLRASPRFPSEVIPEDFENSMRTFRFIALTVANDIFVNILKADTGSIPAYLEEFIATSLSSPPPQL